MEDITLAMEIEYLVDRYCRRTVNDCREKSTTRNVKTRIRTLRWLAMNFRVLET